MTVSTDPGLPTASDWPLFKTHWLAAPTGCPASGSGGDPSAGSHRDGALELRAEARELLRRHGAAARHSQYVEVHLAHG
jgi:hypothetical protein